MRVRAVLIPAGHHQLQACRHITTTFGKVKLYHIFASENSRTTIISGVFSNLFVLPLTYQQKYEHPIKVREDIHELAGQAHTQDIEIYSSRDPSHGRRYQTVIANVVRQRGHDQENSLPTTESLEVVQN